MATAPTDAIPRAPQEVLWDAKCEAPTGTRQPLWVAGRLPWSSLPGGGEVPDCTDPAGGQVCVRNESHQEATSPGLSGTSIPTVKMPLR
jgi:hypothetical protein